MSRGLRFVFLLSYNLQAKLHLSFRQHYVSLRRDSSRINSQSDFLNAAVPFLNVSASTTILHSRIILDDEDSLSRDRTALRLLLIISFARGTKARGAHHCCKIVDTMNRSRNVNEWSRGRAAELRAISILQLHFSLITENGPMIMTIFNVIKYWYSILIF